MRNAELLQSMQPMYDIDQRNNAAFAVNGDQPEPGMARAVGENIPTNGATKPDVIALQPWKPRGKEVALPHGGLPEVIPPYLRELIDETGGPDGPIGRQFVARPDLELAEYTGANDSLDEDHHEVAPGLVLKYPGGQDQHGEYTGRGLMTITRTCGAYCRYCTRGREVGAAEGHATGTAGALGRSQSLEPEQIEQTLDYIENDQLLNEVILSGGDPLTVKPDVLKYVLGRLGDMQRRDKLDIVRVGTRLPIHNPRAIKARHYEALAQLQHPKLMVHINHPAELTSEALAVLQGFKRNSDATIYSQGVLLRGVNDNVQTLREKFKKEVKNGITPYYMYQNDDVSWARHMTVPMDEAIALWQDVRRTSSGLAAQARFVIDVPHGHGKVPLPEGDGWDVNYASGYKDFKGKKFYLPGVQVFNAAEHANGRGTQA